MYATAGKRDGQIIKYMLGRGLKDDKKVEKASALDREMSECAHCECRATYMRRFGRGKAATAIWDKVSDLHIN